MNKLTYCGLSTGISLASVMFSQPAHAVDIIDTTAQNKPTPIKLIPGQISAIHFNNGEKIEYLNLSDRSKIVYSVNAPTDTGATQSIFLKAIEELHFPGEITTSQPNLYVVVLDSQGQQKQYQFVFDNAEQQETEINIVAPEVKPTPPTKTIRTELGEASLDDIRTGLKYKLSRGDFSDSERSALNVAEAIAIALNEDQSLLAVARELDIPLALLSELGRTGLALKTRYRLKTAQKSASSLKEMRQLLIEENSLNHEIETPLGVASLKDIELGISVMKEKGRISHHQAIALSKTVQQSQKSNQSLHKAAKNLHVARELLTEAGRLGLAFDARQRIFGSINN